MIHKTHITLNKVTPGDRNMAFVARLYHDSFPPEERRPWPLFEALAADPTSGFDVYVATTDDGASAGFITLWRLGAVSYVEHFAMDPQVRGRGLGGLVIERVIADEAPCPVVLEVEPVGNPDYEPMASRRAGFYSRHGMTLFAGFDYVQPPYAPGLPEVRLMLMASSPDIDLERAAQQIHRRVYGRS